MPPQAPKRKQPTKAAAKSSGTASARGSRAALQRESSLGNGWPQDASGAVAVLAANLRLLRERAGLTLAELAAAAGIGRSTLAQLESGRANPSIETVFALAISLGVPFAHLLSAPTPEVRVVRRGQGIRLDSSDALFHAELLVSTGRRGTSELFTLEFEPGRPHVAEPHALGSVEHVVLVSGALRLGPVDQPVELRPGDLVSFDADVPHLYEGLEPGTMAVAILDYPS